MSAHSQGNGLTITVAAGKGGTGKTLVSTSLALALQRAGVPTVRLLDCDVEEPNAAILLKPRMRGVEPVSILVPAVDLDVCTRCRRCADVCETGAIAVIRRAVVTFPELCSGCGACALVCPVGAITETPRVVGQVSSGATADGLEFHEGRVDVGQMRSGPLVTAVRRKAGEGVTVIDAPPGTACPMQNSVEGADLCILVTEPTPFGQSDLAAAVDTCRALGTPVGVIVNRDGIGDNCVDDYCEAEAIPILLRIPHDREIAKAYSRGETLLDVDDAWAERLLEAVGAAEPLARKDEHAMPRGDGTGPMGQGPMTGRGLGPCNPNNVNPASPQPGVVGGAWSRWIAPVLGGIGQGLAATGRGLGRGMGQGMGRGMGRGRGGGGRGRW